MKKEHSALLLPQLAPSSADRKKEHSALLPPRLAPVLNMSKKARAGLKNLTMIISKNKANTNVHHNLLSLWLQNLFLKTTIGSTSVESMLHSHLIIGLAFLHNKTSVLHCFTILDNITSFP
jgi:hypothetical protein